MANERKYSANPAVIQVDATELTDVHFVAINWDKLRTGKHQGYELFE